MVNGKSIELGSFENIEDAAKARHDAEIEFFGDYSAVLSGVHHEIRYAVGSFFSRS